MRVHEWQDWDLNPSLLDSKAKVYRIRECPIFIQDKEVDVDFSEYL